MIALALFLAAAFGAAGCSYYHVVEPGDTLYGIGKQYGVSVQDIQKQNPGVDPYNLQIGQQLKIPRFPDQRVSDYAGRPDKDQPKPARPKEKDRTAKPEPTPEPQRTPEPKKPEPDRSAQPAPPEKPPVAAPSGQQGQFIWPVPGGKLVSRYGEHSDSVISHGIEIGAPDGSPVLASADGKVILASDEFKGYGNMIVVRHDGNFFSIYSFNRRLLVKKGDTVKQGQKIAEVGQTGRASGPMLHFQIRIGSKAVDPLQYVHKP
jgi:murein DD-endopeptidase MepM/ murein hydrolase activator NlpD